MEDERPYTSNLKGKKKRKEKKKFPFFGSICFVGHLSRCCESDAKCPVECCVARSIIK